MSTHGVLGRFVLVVVVMLMATTCRTDSTLTTSPAEPTALQAFATPTPGTSSSAATPTPPPSAAAAPTTAPTPTVPPPTGELFAEPISSLGNDPFSPPMVPGAPGGPEPIGNTQDPAIDDDDVAEVVKTLNPPVGQASEVDASGIELPAPEPGRITNVGGDAPGLYGGTNVIDVCDKDSLIGFLTNPANAAQGRAWAGVLGIPVDQIPAYVNGLTAVVLRVDTRVTNHGFRNGAAYPIDSVLQAGTAVLIDEYGVPRVRCYCGNPLEPARPLPVAEPTVTGTTWPGLQVDQTIVITQVTVINVIQINNIYGGGVIYVTPGAPITTWTLPTPVPTPTPPAGRFVGVWDGYVTDGEFTLPFVMEVFDDDVGGVAATIDVDTSITVDGDSIAYAAFSPVPFDPITGDFAFELPFSISSGTFFFDALVGVQGSFGTADIVMCEVVEADCVSGEIIRR